MRKITIILMGMLLVATVCLAGPRNSRTLEGKTAFTHLEATGWNQSGNAGYLVLRDTNTIAPVEWYLWVNDLGELYISSHATLTANFTSFPNGSWFNFDRVVGAGTKVGGQ